MKKIFLDTNSLSAIFRGKDEFKDLIENADEIFISPIVIGELLTGFRSGNKEGKNRKILKDFINASLSKIPDITQETAEIYSQIKVFLRNKGIPIPTNDVWIAAGTIETGSVLISSDAHFSQIPLLRLEKYILKDS